MAVDRKVLVTESEDSKGLVAKITNVCFQRGLNITKNSEYVDNINGRFFMRTELEGDFQNSNLLESLAKELPESSRHRLAGEGKKKLAVLVTKEAHCLGELLIKSHYGALDADIVTIIGNHPDLEELANKFSVPFHCIDHNGLDRAAHEGRIQQCLESYEFDYMVLAKYMRILSEKFIGAYKNKIINIHHSFLPAFIGAKPYHQAYERGVKIIGATAHFVTNDLDDGPIITQDVVFVDHSHSPEEMAKAGREVEESVLTGALRKVIEEKVIVYGNRTVVFD